jgi:hypothetical protein
MNETRLYARRGSLSRGRMSYERDMDWDMKDLCPGYERVYVRDISGIFPPYLRDMSGI